MPDPFRKFLVEDLVVLEPDTLVNVTMDEPEKWLKLLPVAFRSPYLWARYSD
jgi:hypothetical protein